ncbi:TolB family protein [Micromonospora sp. NPDC005806]|uniref:TolB family protein n=1 Tax=Micromonospora sp. NPDC005806 TaxID=3364234 RepID=UPI0036ABBE41
MLRFGARDSWGCYVRARTVRAVVAAAVLAGTTGFFVSSGAVSALADTGVITPAPDSEYFFPALLDSLGDLVVDGVHQRLIASDPTNGLIASTSYTGYDGSNGATITNLPGVAGLTLAADAATLYAAVPDSHVIVGYSTTTYAETARITLGDKIYPRDVVVAGGRLWFSYDDGVASGNFGSIDPASSTVTLHSSTGISPYYGAPLIAANPGAPNLIALSEGSRTSGSHVAVYDVSTGTEQQIVEKSIDGLSYLRDLALSADGSQVVVGGAGGALQLSSTDLSTVGSYLNTVGYAVDTAPDGRVAVATRTDIGTPDLYTYDAGSTTALQAFDMPGSMLVNHPGPDQVMANGIVWQPDGRRLFVVTDNNGLIGFRALNEPVATAIALSAPTSAARAASLTIVGTITGSLPAGTALTVTRTDMESTSGTPLASVTTDASGNFTVVDAPPAGGNVTYTVAYAGDDTHLGATATATIAVSLATPTLTLNRSGTVNTYGTTVAMTAHLGSTYTNRTVEIWADPAGSDQANKLLVKGIVDSSGNLTVNLRLTRNTVVTALFRGDARYAARSVKSNLYTKVSVSTAVSYFYKTSSGYYYFHKTRNPVFTTTMTPNRGRKQKLIFEYYSSGAWHTWKSYLLPLSSTGKSTYTLTGTHMTGVKYRVRAAYIAGTSGDSLNYTTYGAYRYFTFTI